MTNPLTPPMPPKPPRQASAARIEPLPLTVTARDINEPGAPIVITKEGIEHVERLAAIGASDTMIARALRIDRMTFRRCRKRQPELDEALAAGRSVLGLELSHHMLAAARQGEWGAALALGRVRLGWGGAGAVSSAQGGNSPEDIPEESKEQKPIDWSKVPSGEVAFTLLVLERVQQLHGDARRPLSESDRKLLEVHAAVHAEVNGREIGEAVLEVLRMKPPPTVGEIMHLRALRLTPHERRQLTAAIDAETVPNGTDTAETAQGKVGAEQVSNRPEQDEQQDDQAASELLDGPGGLQIINGGQDE